MYLRSTSCSLSILVLRRNPDSTASALQKQSTPCAKITSARRSSGAVTRSFWQSESEEFATSYACWVLHLPPPPRRQSVAKLSPIQYKPSEYLRSLRSFSSIVIRFENTSTASTAYSAARIIMSLLYSGDEAAHLLRSSAQCKLMSAHCWDRIAGSILNGPFSPMNPLVMVMSSSASSNWPASPRKRATSMQERDGSSPSSSEHCVAMATPPPGESVSGFCTRITFLFAPGVRIFSSAHSDSTSASAAGAVFVFRSARRHSLAVVVVPQRYAFVPLSSTTLPLNVPAALASSQIPP
mmetsp:Transcript_25622/g.60880  ORF Transcript_25622/g.60880 Transcript_25622/m.60880 type:complete len:296 (+) Transcript_25622:486-1373(+)